MSKASPQVLVVDDNEVVLEGLRLLLKIEDIPAIFVTSPAEAIEQMKRVDIQCALIDLNYKSDTTSGKEGIELLKTLKKISPNVPVIAMTGWAKIDLAVEAIHTGAADFIEKPWVNARLVAMLRAQLANYANSRAQHRLKEENASLRAAMRDMPFVAESAAMRPVMQFIERVGPTDANVLILGENGTGKGVIARMLHDNSLRKEAAFLKVNMGGISDTVFESEMFGHVRGAFTDAKSNRMGRFEIADGGTLFLDEIGNVPPAQQPKLLRVLEDGEYEPLGSSVTQRADVRLISATNENLVEAIRAGNFRQDLLYRLNTMELRLPALRERRDDLVPLARAYMEVHAERYGKYGLRLSPRAERMLLQYNWPGNIRELSHVMERAVLLAEHNEIDEFSYIGDETSQNRLVDMTLAEAEEWLVRRALDSYPGQLSRAADKLGLTRQALYRRMEKFGIATLEEE